MASKCKLNIVQELKFMYRNSHFSIVIHTTEFLENNLFGWGKEQGDEMIRKTVKIN